MKIHKRIKIEDKAMERICLLRLSIALQTGGYHGPIYWLRIEEQDEILYRSDVLYNLGDMHVYDPMEGEDGYEDFLYDDEGLLVLSIRSTDTPSLIREGLYLRGTDKRFDKSRVYNEDDLDITIPHIIRSFSALHPDVTCDIEDEDTTEQAFACSLAISILKSSYGELT